MLFLWLVDVYSYFQRFIDQWINSVAVVDDDVISTLLISFYLVKSHGFDAAARLSKTSHVTMSTLHIHMHLHCTFS